jgi:hypothetical protein
VNYLERYHNGEYEQVWNDLQALGPNVRREPDYAQAQAVATEMMRRVRRNCERLIARLRVLVLLCQFGMRPAKLRAWRRENVLPMPLANRCLNWTNF